MLSNVLSGLPCGLPCGYFIQFGTYHPVLISLSPSFSERQYLYTKNQPSVDAPTTLNVDTRKITGTALRPTWQDIFFLLLRNQSTQLTVLILE